MAPAISTRGAQVIAWTYVTVSIATCFVVVRLVVRRKVVQVIGKEDACIFFALISALMCCIFKNLQVAKGGLGQHYDTLDASATMLFSKFSYFSIFFYNLSLCLTKFAILFLCLRVFAPSSWRKACYAALVLISIYTAWVLIESIFPCTPIPRYWDKSRKGWCFPSEFTWFVNASLNIFTDFLIVLLPIPGIAKLQLPIRQKIGVSLIFALGIFVCIISIVRLHALYIGSTTHDPTWDDCDIAIWSVVEVNGAIVGACLPTLKPLLSRIWPPPQSSWYSSQGHLRYHRHNRGVTGTLNARRSEREIQRFAADSESAREIITDGGLSLSDMDGKHAIVRVENTTDVERRDHSETRTQMWSSSDVESADVEHRK